MNPSNNTNESLKQPPDPPDIAGSEIYETPIQQFSDTPTVPLLSPAERRIKLRRSVRNAIDVSNDVEVKIKSGKSMKSKKRKQRIKLAKNKGISDAKAKLLNESLISDNSEPIMTKINLNQQQVNSSKSVKEVIGFFESQVEDNTELANESVQPCMELLSCTKNKKYDSPATPYEPDPLPSLTYAVNFKSAAQSVIKMLKKDVEGCDKISDRGNNVNSCEVVVTGFGMGDNCDVGEGDKDRIDVEMENSMFENMVNLETGSVGDTNGHVDTDMVMDSKEEAACIGKNGIRRNDTYAIIKEVSGNHVNEPIAAVHKAQMPIVIDTQRVVGENVVQKSNVWSSSRVTFADMMKKNNEDEELKMEFIPPERLPNGQKRVKFTVEEVKKGGSCFSLQLYGYFIGTSMDYQVVNTNLRRMWRNHDLKEVTKTGAGFCLCKFKSEKGMKEVLESGPWLVNNVPFIINQWEPGVWLEKIEPHKVPLWVCIHNIPIELWNGRSLGKLVSSIGRPILMEPFQPKVGKLNVSYQWKPPLCTHCKVFGHTFKQCKIRPVSAEEEAAKVLKDALKVNAIENSGGNQNETDDDGFQMVGRKNKVVDRLNVKWQQSISGGNRGYQDGGYQFSGQHGYGEQNRQQFQTKGVLPNRGSVFSRIRYNQQAKKVQFVDAKVTEKADSGLIQHGKKVDLGEQINSRSAPVDTSSRYLKKSSAASGA